MRREIIGDAVLYCGDCLEVAAELEASSIDALVSDPPYGLEFMGKDWDKGVPGVHFWKAFFRIVKPGAHLLAFSGTRTYHRMTVAIEDAGWQIRDQLAWVYGSGFPKSLDVSKAIDKAAGAEREVVGSYAGASNIGRKADGKWGYGADGTSNIGADRTVLVTAPATDAAKAWEGWGTALKPAWEPITLARKPLVGTVAGNVLSYGTGAINIDGCRVEVIDGEVRQTTNGGMGQKADRVFGDYARKTVESFDTTQGRWPANLAHDGSDEVVELFPQDQGESAARFFYTAKASREDRDEGLESLPMRARPTMGNGIGGQPDQARANNRNIHPTVKPTDLMRWLVRLITPPRGIVFDPFMGSGSTGKAAMLEGKRFVGAELDPQYFDIACRRIEAAYKLVKSQPTLFDELAATDGKAADILQPSLF